MKPKTLHNKFKKFMFLVDINLFINITSPIRFRPPALLLHFRHLRPAGLLRGEQPFSWSSICKYTDARRINVKSTNLRKYRAAYSHLQYCNEYNTSDGSQDVQSTERFAIPLRKGFQATFRHWGNRVAGHLAKGRRSGEHRVKHHSRACNYNYHNCHETRDRHVE